jgi:hypothetical protein
MRYNACDRKIKHYQGIKENLRTTPWIRTSRRGSASVYRPLGAERERGQAHHASAPPFVAESDVAYTAA